MLHEKCAHAWTVNIAINAQKKWNINYTKLAIPFDQDLEQVPTTNANWPDTVWTTP